LLIEKTAERRIANPPEAQDPIVSLVLQLQYPDFVCVQQDPMTDTMMLFRRVKSLIESRHNIAHVLGRV
jgi:hypothetical protein